MKNPVDMEDQVKSAAKALREVKVHKKCDAYVGISEIFKRWIVFCPLVNELHYPSMRDRHWSTLMEFCDKNMPVTEDILLRSMWNMEPHKFPSEVEEIGEQAKQEGKMEMTLAKWSTLWMEVEFFFEPHKSNESVQLMKLREEDVDKLEENQLQVQGQVLSPAGSSKRWPGPSQVMIGAVSCGF